MTQIESCVLIESDDLYICHLSTTETRFLKSSGYLVDGPKSVTKKFRVLIIDLRVVAVQRLSKVSTGCGCS